MEPTIKDLNVVKTLTNAITVGGKTITEVNVKKMILRPILKRIVFMTEELDRVIVYEGEADFEAHKADSDETLMTALLAKINADYQA
jgi:hypothetical protein